MHHLCHLLANPQTEYNYHISRCCAWFCGHFYSSDCQHDCNHDRHCALFLFRWYAILRSESSRHVLGVNYYSSIEQCATDSPYSWVFSTTLWWAIKGTYNQMDFSSISTLQLGLCQRHDLFIEAKLFLRHQQRRHRIITASIRPVKFAGSVPA